MKFRHKSRCPFSPLLPDIELELLANEKRQEKKRQNNQGEKDKMHIICKLSSLKIQENLWAKY